MVYKQLYHAKKVTGINELMKTEALLHSQSEKNGRLCEPSCSMHSHAKTSPSPQMHHHWGLHGSRSSQPTRNQQGLPLTAESDFILLKCCLFSFKCGLLLLGGRWCMNRLTDRKTTILSHTPNVAAAPLTPFKTFCMAHPHIETQAVTDFEAKKRGECLREK